MHQTNYYRDPSYKVFRYTSIGKAVVKTLAFDWDSRAISEKTAIAKGLAMRKVHVFDRFVVARYEYPLGYATGRYAGKVWDSDRDQ